MKERMLSKSLVVAVILLLLVLTIQPSVAVQPEPEIEIEPKDYLFQTIIDIANNPEVKELLEQYDYDLFKVDIDRSVYRKIFFRNPRLIFNILFTKPSMSVEYLNKCYNNGIEVTNILGEDNVLDIIENVEFTDTNLFDELNNIITNDDEISNQLARLTNINNALITKNDYEDNPLFCAILVILIIGLGIFYCPYAWVSNLYENYGLFPLLTFILGIPAMISLLLIGTVFLMILAFCYMELPIL